MPKKLCTVVDCGRLSHAKGLCRRCYQRADYATPEGRARVRERQRIRYAESPTFAAQVKVDSAARHAKRTSTPEGREAERARLRLVYAGARLDPKRMAAKAASSTAFRERNPEYVEKTRQRKRQPDSRKREKEMERTRLLDPEVAKSRFETARRWRWAKNGFTESLVLGLLVFQKDRCALCTRGIQLAQAHKPDSAQADHCHNTQTPRGLLCRACNTSLGNYEKHQKVFGLVIEPYEQYMTDTPVSLLTSNPVHAILSTQEPANDNEEDTSTANPSFIQR
jgi:hypothetical protein